MEVRRSEIFRNGERLSELGVFSAVGFRCDGSSGDLQSVLFPFRQNLSVEEDCQCALRPFGGSVVAHFHTRGGCHSLAAAYYDCFSTVKQFDATIEIEAYLIKGTGEKPVAVRA